MFTADVPGVARSASGEMARTPESVMCRERRDRGSGRRDLVHVVREVRVVEDRKGRRRVLTPEEAAVLRDPDRFARLPAAVKRQVRIMARVGRETFDDLAPRPRVTLADLEALKERFGR